MSTCVSLWIGCTSIKEWPNLFFFPLLDTPYSARALTLRKIRISSSQLESCCSKGIRKSDSGYELTQLDWQPLLTLHYIYIIHCSSRDLLRAAPDPAIPHHDRPEPLGDGRQDGTTAAPTETSATTAGNNSVQLPQKNILICDLNTKQGPISFVSILWLYIAYPIYGTRFCPTKIDHISDRPYIQSILVIKDHERIEHV